LTGDDQSSPSHNPDKDTLQGRLVGELKIELVNASARQNNPQEIIKCRLKYLGFWVSVAGLFAVVWYAWEAHEQVGAMLIANKNSERFLEITERAYVNVLEVKPEEPLGVGSKREATVYYENTGLTPAKDAWIVLGDIISDRHFANPAKPNWCDIIPNGSVIPPKVMRHRSTDFSKSPNMDSFGFPLRFSKEEFEAIANSREWWYVVANISYHDQFGHCHSTSEPFVYNPQAREFEALTSGFVQTDR
jgi:hypothetical protein